LNSFTQEGEKAV